MKRAVLVPADLHHTAGLVVRDRLRESAIGMARELVAERRLEGDETWYDLGDSGEPAADVARRVAAFGPNSVDLFVPSTHGRAGRILAGSLAEHGLAAAVTPVGGGSLQALDADITLVPRTPEPAWLSGRPATTGWVLGLQPPSVIHDRLASPLPPALHLGDDVWIDRITDWLAASRPAVMAEWRCLLHAHDAHVNPVEAVYAGLHLRDRHRELLVNIL